MMEHDFSYFTLLSLDMKIPVANRNAHFEEFTTWMKANGAEFDGVKITWFEGYGYGIEAEKNFAQGDLLIAVPRKVMLTTENIEGSLLGMLLVFYLYECSNNWPVKCLLKFQWDRWTVFVIVVVSKDHPSIRSV